MNLVPRACFAMAGLVASASTLAVPERLRAQSLDRPGIGFTGTIASVDSFALVMRADNGTLVTFPIEEAFRVPAGLVPGMRVTARYEIVDRTRYRLVGVKIASGPMEHDSTTEPPALSPAQPAAPDAIRQEPGTSPVLPEPQAEPATPEPTPAQPTPQPTTGAAVAPRQPSSVPAAQATLPSEAGRATAALPLATPAAPPGMPDIVTLLTLVAASGALLWLALARL